MDDYISREASVEYLMTNMGWNDEDGYPVDDADEKRKIITDLVSGIPAADVRPVVRGKWIEEYECTHPQAKCSACGEPTLYAVSYDIKGNAYYMNFCPNCGADMREANDG